MSWTHKNNILTWLNAVRKINRLFLDEIDAEDTVYLRAKHSVIFRSGLEDVI